ncbi:hypothetical protein E2C01_091206 [Portunus trituberculatus]|uniref:Uncharacterized protein n=1 Tax=Portunus trituberculatus TaxID=210409 RepID=A0A5B7JUE6_PORTR|nr:hypothetical protein [Portunus trituberculatus]
MEVREVRTELAKTAAAVVVVVVGVVRTPTRSSVRPHSSTPDITLSDLFQHHHQHQQQQQQQQQQPQPDPPSSPLPTPLKHSLTLTLSESFPLFCTFC